MEIEKRKKTDRDKSIYEEIAVHLSAEDIAELLVLAGKVDVSEGFELSDGGVYLAAYLFDRSVTLYFSKTTLHEESSPPAHSGSQES